jgi:hypothetical protein
MRDTPSDSIQRSDRRAERPSPYDIGRSISRDSRKLMLVVTDCVLGSFRKVAVSAELWRCVISAVKGLRNAPQGKDRGHPPKKPGGHIEAVKCVVLARIIFDVS